MLTVNFVHEHHQAKVHVSCVTFMCYGCLYMLLHSIRLWQKLQSVGTS